MRQTLDAKLLLLSVTYTWRIDTMPVYDFGIRFSYRTTGETKQDTYTANVSSEGCVGWEPESICFDMQKVNSDEGLNSNTMCWKLSWEKMSIASTLQFEMKWLYWLKDTRKQDPYVIYVFFSLLFLSAFLSGYDRSSRNPWRSSSRIQGKHVLPLVLRNSISHCATFESAKDLLQNLRNCYFFLNYFPSIEHKVALKKFSEVVLKN